MVFPVGTGEHDPRLRLGARHQFLAANAFRTRKMLAGGGNAFARAKVTALKFDVTNKGPPEIDAPALRLCPAPKVTPVIVPIWSGLTEGFANTLNPNPTIPSLIAKPAA
jgi:hypothetical protein